jgi:hypothetical protein
MGLISGKRVKGIAALLLPGFFLCHENCAAASDVVHQQPDLLPVVVDVNAGVVEIRNAGDAQAAASKLSVICTAIDAATKKRAPCAAGLDLPNYSARYNELIYPVPALKPDEKYSLTLFDPRTFPRPQTPFAATLFVDRYKDVAESDESNNGTQLRAVAEKTKAVMAPSQTPAQINLTVTLNGEAVKAEIEAFRKGKAGIAYGSHYQPGGPALASPIHFSLPAGGYDLHIRPYGKSLFIDKTVALQVKAGEQLDRAIDLSSGHLEINTESGGETLSGKVTILHDDVLLPGSSGVSLYTPCSIDLAPGDYTVLVTNPQDRSQQSVAVTVKAMGETKKTITFDTLHAGYIDIHMLVNGTELPANVETTYASIEVVDADTQQVVMPINGGYGAVGRYPSGVYDIHVRQHVIGVPDTLFRAVHLGDGETVSENVTLPTPGELKLVGMWTHQPLNLADCARYNNPLNPDRLGSLMGGHSVSRGECLDPVVNSMTVWISTAGRADGNIARLDKYSLPQKLIPGSYDITVWPEGHQELLQTIGHVTIKAGEVAEKHLDFHWPEKKK